MQCPACDHEILADARFCDGCGLRLLRDCPNCSRDLRLGARFCDACGQPVNEVEGSAPPTPSPDAPEQPAASDAERRQLTVMFCDLVDSTALAERLGPEDLREAVRTWQSACDDVIQSLDGRIVQFLGDGLLVYFGHPQAHEDDAIRAVTAARGMIDDLSQLNARLGERLPLLQESPLQVRIGIHTGPVVVGEIGSGAKREQLAMGDTVNIASRLHAIADPDSVVISEATQRLVQGAVVLEDLGPRTIRGVREAISTFRVSQISGMSTHSELAAAGELTPLVGREQETALLLDRWEQVREGVGQVVLLSGEAGIGKSRLVQALRAHLADDPHTWVECQGSAHHESSALHPVIALLELAMLYRREDSPEERIAKLERGLRPVGFELEEAVPLFAALLSVPLIEPYRPSGLSPEAQKRRTLEALVRWLFALTEVQPLVLVLEDLHWMDPSTLELVGMIQEQAPTVPIFLVVTYRTGFELPWPARSHPAHLSLHPLTRRQMRSMVEGLTGGKLLPEEVTVQILDKTDGVPLFVEEFTKSVLESELLEEGEQRYALSGAILELAIPSTIRDSLAARLDRLGPAKEIAQLASVLGRRFSSELLHAAAALEGAALETGLDQLVQAEILYRRGLGTDATYVFKHALIQDTAYDSLLVAPRREHHRRVAEALAKSLPDIVQAEPELLAWHYSEADLSEPAIAHWRLAGQRAIERSANLEAVLHLERARELLATQPETDLRKEEELGIQTLLGVALIETKGYAAEEVERAFARAKVLCDELGEAPQQFPILMGLFLFRMVRAEAEAVAELVDPLVAFAERSRDPGFLVEAHVAAGIRAFYRGRHEEADEHWQRMIAHYDPVQHGGHAFVYGQDPAVFAHAYGCLNWWLRGWPDRALESADRAIELAERIGHPFSLAGALTQAADLRHYRGEVHECRALSDRGLALAEEQGFPLWYGANMVCRGWAMVQLGDVDGGLAGLEQGRILFRSTGAEVEVPLFLSMLADSLLAVGNAEGGLTAADEALALTEKNLDRNLAPELHRLRGELLRIGARPDPTEAGRCFQRAVEQSRVFGARSLELRSATSLARLWQSQNKEAEAHDLLQPVYDCFTEGFDTQDLKDAKELLAELSS